MATGSINAKLALIVAGIIRIRGSISLDNATAARIGINKTAVAVLLVSSVKNVTTRQINNINTNSGTLPSSPNELPSSALNPDASKAIFATLPLKLASIRVSWIVAAIILASNFYGNWWAQELRSFKQFPTFRDEDWVATATALANLNSSEPVFQLADVIEDIDALTIEDVRFQEYLLFPLRGAEAMQGCYRQPEVSVLPTWNVQFTSEHLDSIRDAKGCWLIVRGDLDYALIIPDVLEQHLRQSIEFKFIPNEQMPQSRVHLIRVRLAK